MNVIISKITGGKKFNCYGQEIIPCRLCGNGTVMLGTKLCDCCWELKARIERDPELAEKILNGVIGDG